MDILLMVLCAVAVLKFFAGKSEEKIILIIILACLIPPGVILLGKQLFWLLLYSGVPVLLLPAGKPAAGQTSV